LLPKIKENKVDPVISKDQIVKNHFSGKSKLRIQSKLVWRIFLVIYLMYRECFRQYHI